MMSETGFELKQRFKTAKRFASWLGFAPNRKITGDKVISSRTPKVKKPLTAAIKQAANSAGNSKPVWAISLEGSLIAKVER